MGLLHQPQALDEGKYNAYVRGNTFPTEEDVLPKRAKASGTNMAALAYAASEALGNYSVPTIKHIGSGSFNDVFLLTCPDGSEIVARVPVPKFRIPGKIPSVVATMTFARHVLALPCPKVYAWNDSHRTIVGSPYILMEKAHGVHPWKIQPWLCDDEIKLKVLDSIAQIHAKLAQPLTFSPSIGSIHFSVNAFSRGAEGLHDIDYSSPSLYRLGPFVRSATLGIDSLNINGVTRPHSSLKALWDEFINMELSTSLQRWSQDRNINVIPDDIDFLFYCRESESLGDVLDAGKNLRTLASSCTLPEDKELSASCLVSSDFAYRNLLVDPETLKVSAILDWDDFSVMPFILCTRMPDEICSSLYASAAWRKQKGNFPFVPCEEPPSPDLPKEDSREGRCYDQRQFYKERLALYDGRFSRKGFWALREDPLKIQYLVTYGWVHWLSKDDWLKQKVAGSKSNHKDSSVEKGLFLRSAL